VVITERLRPLIPTVQVPEQRHGVVPEHGIFRHRAILPQTAHNHPNSEGCGGLAIDAYYSQSQASSNSATAGGATAAQIRDQAQLCLDLLDQYQASVPRRAASYAEKECAPMLKHLAAALILFDVATANGKRMPVHNRQ
jgi:hypothetical protein